MNTRLTLVFISSFGFVFRFLRLGAIENDHYVYLARAHQVLHGDWPVRDFADPGIPLGYLLSTVAAAIAGPTLLTEAVVSVALFAIGLALTFALARRASGSGAVGLLAAALVLWVPPRLYNSSKMLVPLAAMALAWSYADRPDARRAAALGAWTGAAFLFRHDYAVYVGTSAAALLLVRHWGDWRLLLRRSLACALVALAIAGPWLVYVQWQQGLPEYLASAMRFSVAEGNRTVSGWAPVYYMMAAVPVAALVLAARGTRHLSPAHVVFAAMLVLLADLVLLRDAPGSRLPDVYAVTAVVAAIVVGLFTPRRASEGRDHRGHRTAATAVTAVAVVVIAGIVLPGPDIGLPETVDARARWHRVVARLRDARPEIMPTPERAALIGYISRCTTPEERVLIGGFAPEIPVLARRAFAGGLPDWIRGYYEHPEDVARARAQLARERVAVAVMLDGGVAFADSWPALAGDLQARGLTPYELQLPSERVELWIRPATSRDALTGLPCAGKT